MKNPASGVNEDPVVNVQMLVKGMIETLPTTTIDRLASVNIKERRQSVSDIISVVPNTQDHSNVIQIIPLELLSNNKIVEAIWYMVEGGRKAKLCFSPEVIRSVFDAAYAMKEQYGTISPQSETQISEMVFLQKILKQMLFAQLDLSQGNVELFPTVWDYYALFEMMPDTARSYYYDAVGIGDMTAILRSVQYCMDEGNADVAFSLLKNGYEQSGDILFLEKHIELLFLLGDTELAKKMYSMLLKDFPDHSSPILRYKWHIENDDDIDELEIIMEGFYIDPKPTDIHKKLTTSAKEYLNRKIDELLIAVETMELGMNDYQLKAELILRRMAYMEKHIFLLLDDTYLEEYLEDIKLLLLGDLDAQLLLSEFFELYPLNISQSQVRFDDTDATGKIQESPLTHPQNLEDMAAQRLTYIACRFFESGNEEIFRNIAILGEKSLHNYLDIESKARDIVRYLEKESKDMAELSPDANIIYYHIIRSLDKNYGTYFRRHIQYLARHPYRTEWNKYPEILESIPLAGMFFLMETMLSHSAGDIDMDMCIHAFSIDLLPLPEALLFARVLMDNGFYNEGIVYISRLEWIFFEPEFLELIVDGIGHMENSKAARQIVEHLDAVCQEKYKEKSFFAFVNKSAKKLQEGISAYPQDLDSLDIATGHIHMFRGNDKKALRKFANAAGRGSVEGIIQSARILENSLGRKDDALDLYIHAFSLGQDYKSTEILQSIISLCTRLEKPDLRNHYIQIALHNESLDSWDLFSLDLYGNDEERYRALRWVTGDEGVWTNATEHLILEEYIDNNITKEVLGTELDLRNFLLSSYVKGVEQNDSKLLDPKGLLQHWHNIMSISFDPDEPAVAAVCILYREFIDIPESLSDGDEDERNALDDLVYAEPYDNSFQELSILMHVHAHDFCTHFGRIISNAYKTREEVQWKSYVEDYAVFLGMVISVFRRIPEGGPYVERWQTELDKTLHVMSGTNPSHMPPGNHTYLQ